MGCGQSGGTTTLDSSKTSQEVAKEGKADQQVDNWLSDKQSHESRVKKLLLLGSGSSGKSTLFKQLKQIYKDDGFEDSEYVESRHIIRRNLCSAVLTILKKSQELYDSDPQKHAGCHLPINDNPSPEQTDDLQLLQDVRLVFLFSKETFEGVNDIDFDEALEAQETEEKEDVGMYVGVLPSPFFTPFLPVRCSRRPRICERCH